MSNKLDLADDIVAFAQLLTVLLARPDAENAKDGMHRVAAEIWERATELRQALDDTNE